MGEQPDESVERWTAKRRAALYFLCTGQTGDPCDKAPKYGSYVAP